MGFRKSKAPPKTVPTVRTEIQALDELDTRLERNPKFGVNARAEAEILSARIAAMTYALTWQQGRASQRPSAWVLEMNAT